ncbi:MAG: hypothetical protein ACW98X_22990, partial [Promethearchaeota archaeon]
QAEDDAQLAAITLKKFGGDMPKYQYQGEVLPNESDYTSLYDANVYAQGIPELDQYSTMYDAMYNQPRQRVKINMPSESSPRVGETHSSWLSRQGVPGGGIKLNESTWNGQTWVEPGSATPVTSNRATRYQNIPKGKDVRKWDMTAEGYDEASVKPGDYIKKADGKWYKAEMVDIKTTPYEGELDDRLGTLGEAYGRLEKRIKENPKLQDALYKKYKENMAKATTRNNLSEVDLKRAREMSKEQVIDNFLKAEKQIMAVQAKGPIENADAWDKNLDNYKNTISELGFDPMDAAETAAFQGAYISMQNLVDADPKYRKQLNDFKLDFDTRRGKDDEAGGGTGRKTISDIDGWFGNTTIGQSLLYAPKEKELKMKEAEWKEAKKDPAVKHLANTYKQQKTPFWTEDVMKLGFGLRNLFDIRKEQPWIARPDVVLPLSAQQQGVQGAAAFGNPQAYMANTAALQANAMQQVSNAIGTVDTLNSKIANQFEMQRANILNRSNEKRAMLATKLYDRHKVLNQQYRNANNQAWDSIQRNLVNAWTNRGKAQAMNEMSDNFAMDTRTGFLNKTWDRPLNPKKANQPDISERYNSLMKSMPGVNPDVLARIAAKQSGISTSPTQFTGVDPNVLNMGYPAGSAGYYPPQG